MGWFSMFSIILFLSLIVRSVIRIRKNPRARLKNVFLVLIFGVHIAAIVYMSLD